MNADLEQKLAEAFPFMRRKRDLSEQAARGTVNELYDAFGCECGDGWYGVIYGLCAGITEAYKKYGKPIDIAVDQVKEKYGGLRFYYSFTSSSSDFTEVHREVDAISTEWEKKSEEVCEQCGKPGALRENLPWITALGFYRGAVVSV